MKKWSNAAAHLTRFVLGTVVLAPMLGCGADNVIAPKGVSPAAPRASIYDPSTRTLGVTITSNGPSRFTNPGNYVLTANVSGGTAPYQYQWYQQICYTDGFCSDDQLFAYGSGVNPVTVEISSDMTDMHWTVVVGDASANTWTGVGVLNKMGPAYGSGFGGPNTCATYPGDDETIGYPFYVGVPPDPTHQTGYFRVNPCTHSDVYQLTS